MSATTCITRKRVDFYAKYCTTNNIFLHRTLLIDPRTKVRWTNAHTLKATAKIILEYLIQWITIDCYTPWSMSIRKVSIDPAPHAGHRCGHLQMIFLCILHCAPLQLLAPPLEKEPCKSKFHQIRLPVNQEHLMLDPGFPLDRYGCSRWCRDDHR